MTEDDTFLKLRRTPLEDMIIKYLSWAASYPIHNKDARALDREWLLNEHGWTWDTFRAEYQRLLMNSKTV